MVSVEFVVEMYRGDRFVAATNNTVRMCIYSFVEYVLDFKESLA